MGVAHTSISRKFSGGPYSSSKDCWRASGIDCIVGGQGRARAVVRDCLYAGGAGALRASDDGAPSVACERWGRRAAVAPDGLDDGDVWAAPLNIQGH